jgi:pyridoxal phosphate enzyme (YggS family)
VSTIAESLAGIRRDISRIAKECGRDPGKIRLLAVSKTFPPAAVDAACAAGHYSFGENRIQEAQVKIPLVKSNKVDWHFIGHLQSNKARIAASLFDCVQTIDSQKIARRLNSACMELKKTLRVLIQVNVGEEPQKSGVHPEEVAALLEVVEGCSHLDVRGLMAIPPFLENPEDVRPYFAGLAELLARINRGRNQPLIELSMGMSNDYQIAIQEGATIVRLGTAIFGPRTY